MKNLYIIIVIIFVVGKTFAQDWFIQTTTGIIGDNNYSIVFPSVDTGYFSQENHNSFFLRVSYDGGSNWKDIAPYSFYPHSPSFLNSKTGYFADGDSYILRTEDAGNSWKKFGIDTLNTGINQIQFISSKIGFLCGGDADQVGKVYKTLDSGKTWVRIFINGSGYISEVNFKDSMTGYIVLIEHEPNIYRQLFSTTDGGMHWKQDEIARPFVQKNIHYLRRENLWLGTLTNNTLIYWKSDSSFFFLDTLHQIEDTNVNEYIRALIFFNDSIGYLLTNNTGKVFKTIDTGKTWFLQKTPNGFNAGRSIFAPSPIIGYAVGYGQNGCEIIKTTDGGGPPMNKVARVTNIFSLRISPDPVTVSADFQFNVLNMPTSFELFDALGRSVLHQHLSVGEESLHINMQNFPAGLYFVRLGEQIGRFVKM